jgi:hypothetical protein
MSNLETVAAQRDEANAKVREMARQLEAANAEIARLKGPKVEVSIEDRRVDITTVSDDPAAPRPPIAELRSEVPNASPPKQKRRTIFGG